MFWMPNGETKPIELTIVYYGISQSGKTTNLKKLHEMGELDDFIKITVADKWQGGDKKRRICVDFATKNITLDDYTISLTLYAYPAQSGYGVKTLRKVDGIVFVVDSQRKKLAENIKLYNRLKEDLLYIGKRFEDVPLFLQFEKTDSPNPILESYLKDPTLENSLEDVSLVFQYNKMDYADAVSYEELEKAINPYGYPSMPAIATRGEGVLETFRILESILISKIRGALL
ncbi:MAG: hypothetical protein ACK4FY_00190 [Aquificaceae bacterium]